MWPISKEKNKNWQKILSWLGLFGSLSTIFCCALPSLLVLIGLGSSVASFLGYFPQLIWLSENKGFVFGGSFLLLGLAYAAQKFAATQVCPIDQKDNCNETKNWSKKILFISFIINLIGFTYAFILPPLMLKFF